MTFANQVSLKVTWIRNMDYVMHVKYSSFHRQFSKFSPSRPNSITWNTGSQGGIGICRHYIKDRALQDSEYVSYNGTESSGTSGKQLKLIDYRLLVLSQPEKSIVCLYLRSFRQRRPAYYARFLKCSYCIDTQ